MTEVSVTCGLFQLNALPFGLQALSGMFHAAMHQAMQQLDDVLVRQDDYFDAAEIKQYTAEIRTHSAGSVECLHQSSQIQNESLSPGIPWLLKSMRVRTNRIPCYLKPLVGMKSQRDESSIGPVTGSVQHFSPFIPDFAVRD